MRRSGFSHDEAFPLAVLCLCIFLIFDFFSIKFISIPFGVLGLAFCIFHFFFQAEMHFIKRKRQSDINDCLNFLQINQPLPSTELISKEILKQFEDALGLLKGQRVEESIPLLLNCFGEGDGHCAYQRVEEVVAKHAKEAVLPYLAQALTNQKGSVRYWCAQIARRFPDSSLLIPLRDLVLNGRAEERAAALLAIEAINTPEATRFLNEIDQP